MVKWAEDLIAEERLRREGFFDSTPIRAKWSEQVSGRCHWHHQLWIILMVQSWLSAEGSGA